ncbi:Afadin and alpha-actinin-binding-domain-containing protein [Xylaria sp. FL0043]|nr:Afadin and alpha-actinin-binding-domain-containing protein [Xylaria sp. FL0043]
MIDPENLRTASLYINNQLLSRGLLRDGQNIDFADPESSDGGLQVAMGHIISVVNDLILRRDRDADHRESLSSALRVLRADAQRQTTEFARQTEKLNDTQRRLDTAEATERALRAQLKTAEQGIHKLKDEMAKMKSLVAQTRSACANEVRKRDRHIDSLKKAVTDAGRVRGGGRSRNVITINVTGEFSNEEDEGMGMPVGATADEGYSLRMETNGFLTELAKGLSEENEGLLALVRRTVDGLREMSGLNRGTNHHNNQGQDSTVRDEFVTQMPHKSAEELAAELEAIVEHLRSILTNPSFVPIEEVEVRDEAIGRLRAGLETMEARWKDAVHMIDGWRRRMTSSGKSVDIEDLQMGLRLSPVRVRDVAETANIEPMRLSHIQEEEEEEDEDEDEDDAVQYDSNQDLKPEPRRFGSRSPAESLRLVPTPQYDAEELGDDSDSESSIFQDDLDIDDLDVEEPNVQILQMSTNDPMDSSPLPEPPQLSPLKDSYSSGNRGAAHNSPYRKRPGDFTTIIEENTWDLAAAEEKVAPAPPSLTIKPVSPTQKSKKSPQQIDEDGLPSYTTSYDSPLFGKSGGKPSQAQLNGKLFSKPSPEQRPRNTAVGTSISQREKVSPASTRTTRSSAKKSRETSPAAGQVAAQTAKQNGLGADDAPSTTSNAAPTSTSKSTSSTSTTTTSLQVPAVEITQQDTSINSSSSSSSASDRKQARGLSPGRAQPRTRSPAVASSRLPRPHAQQSPLNMATIAAKLAASEREADAARVRAKLRAVRRSRRISGAGPEEQTGTQAQAKSPAKREISTEDNKKDIGDVAQTEARPSPRPSPRPHRHHTLEAKEDVDPIKRDVDNTGLDSAAGGAGIGVTVVENKQRKKRAPRRRLSCAPVGDDADELGGDAQGDMYDEGELGNGEDADGKLGANAARRVEEECGESGNGLEVLKNRKRVLKRSDKVASRRRSTLSPWELRGLISGHVGDVSSPAR